MYRVGSTASTEAPAFAASTVAGPIPAPMSMTCSPGRGEIVRTTSRLTGDLHIFGNCLM